MALRFYADSGLTRRISEVLGVATGGTEIPNVDEEPAEVRFFSSSTPYDEAWTKVSGTPTGKQWRYDSANKKVILGQAVSGGTIVAISAGEKLFEGVNTLSGLSAFLSSSANADDRTKVQQIWIANDEANRQYTEIKVSAIQDLVSGAGAQASWISVSSDGSTWANPPLSISNIVGIQSRSFYVRCIVPQGTPVENYRDVYLELTALESSTN